MCGCTGRSCNCARSCLWQPTVDDRVTGAGGWVWARRWWFPWSTWMRRIMLWRWSGLWWSRGWLFCTGRLLRRWRKLFPNCMRNHRCTGVARGCGSAMWCGNRLVCRPWALASAAWVDRGRATWLTWSSWVDRWIHHTVFTALRSFRDKVHCIQTECMLMISNMRNGQVSLVMSIGDRTLHMYPVYPHSPYNNTNSHLINTENTYAMRHFMDNMVCVHIYIETYTYRLRHRMNTTVSSGSLMAPETPLNGIPPPTAWSDLIHQEVFATCNTITVDSSFSLRASWSHRCGIESVLDDT